MKHKILLVLLLSSMACITATAQKVSMDFRQVKLAKVFDAITQQTGLTVAYSRQSGLLGNGIKDLRQLPNRPD